MPTYEYKCNVDNGGCGYKFEMLQSYKEKPLEKCPKCEQSKLSKVFSSPAVVFKGTGFYETDYRSKN